MSQVRILVADDELPMRRFLGTILEAHGYLFAAAEDGSATLEHVTAWRPDVLLLDLWLPRLDGLAVICQLRTWSALPVIVLSACDREADKVAALNAGADDYLTKPFGSAELLARIQVALRHATPIAAPVAEAVLTVGDLQLDLAAHRALRCGEELYLTPTEYALLRTLMLQCGQVVTHAALLRAVWGAYTPQESGKLRVFINQLRHKIEETPARPRFLLTEPGVGYRLAE